MSLSDKFLKFMSEYNDELIKARASGDYKRPWGNLVRHEIVDELKKYVDSSLYNVKGSVGAGRWTDVPWIAIFDKRITTSAQRGVYIVYLLNKNTKELFLTFNQGATDIAQGSENKVEKRLKFTGIASSGNDKTTSNLKKRALEIRENLGREYDAETGEIFTGSRAYDAGCIFFKRYLVESLPSDEQLLKDLTEFIKIYSDYQKRAVFEDKIWWPSINDYNSRITKEQWLETLNDGSTFTENALSAIAAFYDYGGEATCVQLKERYGRTSDFYRNTLGVNLAEKVKKKYHIPDYTNGEENSKLWPIVFLGRDAKKNERGSYVWKIRPELYDALTEFDILRFLPVKEAGENSMFAKENIEKIKEYLSANKFNMNAGVIENLYLSLMAKPFVILAGVSGTGKSKIARLFAEAVGGQFKLIPVKPDWSDASDLLGHVDLDGNFVPGKLTEFLYEANKEDNKDTPFFVCLDEMNLARVEYYFSDFLSVIETRHIDESTKRIVTDKIFSGEEFMRDKTGAKDKYGNLIISDNVYVIGTVNMDETTYPFSKKVLDRANTIEFSDINLQAGIEVEDAEGEGEPTPISLSNSELKAKYVEFADCYPGSRDEDIKSMVVLLEAVNKALKYINSQVAYRVRNEMAYYLLYSLEEDVFTYEQALDNEMMQKVLPRIQGSGQGTEDALRGILNAIVQDHMFNENELSSELDKYVEDKGEKYYPYKRSVEKIQFMLRRLERDGYTSYWL